MGKVPYSKFIGVDYVNIGNGSWCASLLVNRKKEFIGVHNSERKAARAVNAECRKRGMKISNPEVENDSTDSELSEYESESHASEDRAVKKEQFVPAAAPTPDTLRDFFNEEIRALRQQVMFYKEALKSAEALANRLKED